MTHSLIYIYILFFGFFLYWGALIVVLVQLTRFISLFLGKELQVSMTGQELAP